MFVLELSKQTGICLAATERVELAPAPRARAASGWSGYLICSRYDTVWHVMNVAVDLHRQRMGLASRLLAELYARVGDEQARFTLEVRRSNAVAIHLYEREGFRAAGTRRRYYQDNGEDALVMWRTPATRAGLAGGRAQPRTGMTILALETSCDDTCAAVIDEHGRILANVISSQTAHEDFGGVVPEIASRHHLELVNAIVRGRSTSPAIGLDDVSLVGATQGPGLVGALLVGLSTAKALAAARELPFAPVDHLQGHVAANFLVEDGDMPFEPPFVCLIASGGHTLLAHVREHDGFEVLGRTLDDAAGEAFDKGARMLGLGYPGGAALERLARDGDPQAFVFPGSRARALARRARRAPPGLRRRPGLLLRRPEDGAALQAARAARRDRPSSVAPISRPPIRRRSSTA